MNKKSLVLVVGIGLSILIYPGLRGAGVSDNQALQITAKNWGGVSQGGIIGLCPMWANIDGDITVNQPCVVQYRSIRSDGVAGQTQSWTFQGNSLTHNVTVQTNFDHDFNGWVAIQVISPLQTMSEKQPFTAHCLPRPQISQVRLATDGKLQIQVIGGNLRSPEGRNLLSIDDKITMNTLIGNAPNPLWTDTMIAVSIKNIVSADHTYEFKIVDGDYGSNKIFSNVFSVKFLYPITDIKPAPAKAGGEVEIKVLYLPENPTGLELRFASYKMEVLSWIPGSGTIKAKIPHIVPGTYDVYLRKGAVAASTVAKIKVVGGG